MQAARLVEGTVAVETVPIPEPKPGEARLKIIQGGVCNTDVELTRGCVCAAGLAFILMRRAALVPSMGV
jgi:D-arabinose 1-dehydrogenase-like Zn-dependent alcohol dehydrogenase